MCAKIKIDYTKIGSQIRKYRKAKGMSQEQLAAKAGVGITHISHIETGNTIPSTSTLLDIINALDLSADELFCDYIAKCRPIFHNRIADCLEDCSEEEIRIISDMAEGLKTSLRARNSQPVQKKWLDININYGILKSTL